MRRQPIRRSDVPAHARRLLEVPNVGPATVRDLLKLGISEPEQLAGQSPDKMYESLCKIDGVRHDPCLLDVFTAAVSYGNGEPAQAWWAFTPERKARAARRGRKRGRAG